MHILLTGSSGLIGTDLLEFLERKNCRVTRVVRTGTAGDGALGWDMCSGPLDEKNLDGIDAVVHLAGESIATGRWTAAKMDRILKSRVESTKLLAKSIARTDRPPRVLVTASAVGYYGDRGDELLTEESASGNLFLSTVCREWEAAAQPAVEKGVRVVSLRFGVVLSTRGGALTKMLTPFRMCLGGRIGDGRQYMSWIALEDALRAIDFVLQNESLKDPVNVVTPNAVTNLEFTKTLGRALGRPTVFPMPAFVARLAFGRMADELLLSSARVSPAKLAKAGFEFKHAQLEDALGDILGVSGRNPK